MLNLHRLLDRIGRPDLRELLDQLHIDLEFSDGDKDLADRLPSEGDGLVVVTDDDFAHKYLSDNSFYSEETLFSIREERVSASDSILDASIPTVVMGFGGGRVLDVAKMTAKKSGVPLISVPTAPTHDGLISRNAALIDNGQKKSFQTVYPSKVIIPEHLWREAGSLAKAGYLDILTNVVALQDVSLAEKMRFDTEEQYVSRSAGAVETLLEGGKDSLAEALLLSGLSMHETSRYCSGSEHELEKVMRRHYGLRYFHGQLAGTGALLASYVYTQEEIEKLYFDSSELYPQLRETFDARDLLDYSLLPLRENSLDELVEVLEEVSEVRPDRYTLWNEVDSREIDWHDVMESIL